MLEQFPRARSLKNQAQLLKVTARLKARLAADRTSRVVFVLNEEFWLASDVKKTLERLGLEGKKAVTR